MIFLTIAPGNPRSAWSDLDKALLVSLYFSPNTPKSNQVRRPWQFETSLGNWQLQIFLNARPRLLFSPQFLWAFAFLQRLLPGQSHHSLCDGKIFGFGGSHCLVPGTNVHKEKLNMHVAWRVAVVWKRFVPLSCGKAKILKMQQLQQLQRDSDANCFEPLASSWQQKVLAKYFNSVFPSMA